jgi:hypothetical protein
MTLKVIIYDHDMFMIQVIGVQIGLLRASRVALDDCNA